MRMLRRGLNSPLFFEASSLLAFRLKSRFGLDRSLAENISDTPRGVDEFGIPGIALYLLAEVADMDVHRAFVAELVAPHPATWQVDPEPVVGQFVGTLARRYRGPAHDRPDARHQLPDGERLGDVVISPQLEPDDPVYLVVAGGQHDDGHVALRPDPPYNLRAVELGEHDVQHDQVRLIGLERFQSGLAVA